MRSRRQNVIYQTSSVGRLDKAFQAQIAETIGGRIGGRWMIPTSQHFGCYSPTQRYIASKNKGGAFSESILFCPQNAWDMSTFPRSWFCNTAACNAGREGLMLHSNFQGVPTRQPFPPLQLDIYWEPQFLAVGLGKAGAEERATTSSACCFFRSSAI